MNTQPSSRYKNVENDPRLLFWFAIILMLAVFIWSFFLTPRLRQPSYYLPFTGLFGIHIFLHWKFDWACKHPRWLIGYTFVQGLLAFGITYLSGNVGMVFCLFMALIGELLSIFKISILGILTAVYMLVLAFVNFGLLLGYRQAGWFLLGTVPTVVFIAIYVILYTRQAEANTRAQALLRELESANRQLTEYAARVEDLTIAEERQRMARELHDTLSQGLAGLILQLEAVDAHLSNSRPERARSILKQSMQTARETLADARQAIDNLRQPSGRDLAEVVRHEAERFTRAAGIACESQIDVKLEVPQAAAEAAIRAITEALTNVARHARASHVSLHLSTLEKSLQIEICDDGIGFDPEVIQAGHYGLLGMGERVRLAGGSFAVHSIPGDGTRITISLPLEKLPNA